MATQAARRGISSVEPRSSLVTTLIAVIDCSGAVLFFPPRYRKLILNMSRTIAGPLHVFLTFDVEAWPEKTDWRETSLQSEIDLHVYGQSDDGPCGIGHQIELLNRFDLRGVFFVESLFASAVGIEPLGGIVETIRKGKQDVQLHVHPEWLDWMNAPPVPGKGRQHCSQFSRADQATLIGLALDNLRKAGATDVVAFRAGNYGANDETLQTLADLGLQYDSSHNASNLGDAYKVEGRTLASQPTEMFGILELPVSVFTDWPSHIRHAQITATSAAELEHALSCAWNNDWTAFVIVSHSHEHLKRNGGRKLPRIDQIVHRRFARLCRFLDRHRDRFMTCGFAGQDLSHLLSAGQVRPIKSSPFRTVRRVGQQLLRRIT